MTPDRGDRSATTAAAESAQLAAHRAEKRRAALARQATALRWQMEEHRRAIEICRRAGLRYGRAERRLRRAADALGAVTCELHALAEPYPS